MRLRESRGPPPQPSADTRRSKGPGRRAAPFVDHAQCSLIALSTALPLAARAARSSVASYVIEPHRPAAARSDPQDRSKLATASGTGTVPASVASQ